MTAAPRLLDRGALVPVVVLDDPADAVPLARALLAGGIEIMEVTLRTSAGLEGLARVAREVPDMHVGAGSVLGAHDVDAVAEAGARFVVSPGLSEEVLDRCAQRALAPLPGVATPSELMTAVTRGLDEVKIFPAASLGGPGFLRALAGPFPAVRFLPSGGIGPDTMADYLALPSVPAVSGSWMVERDLLAAHDWAEVSRRAQRATDEARAARVGAGGRTG